MKHDIIEDEEFEAMSSFIYDEIDKTLNHIKDRGLKTLIGIGGTITSLSAMNQELEVYSMEKYIIVKYTKRNRRNSTKLIKMTLSDKKNLKGLQEKRADIITAGVKILNIIMEKLEIEEITVSEYDNLKA